MRRRQAISSLVLPSLFACLVLGLAASCTPGNASAGDASAKGATTSAAAGGGTLTGKYEAKDADGTVIGVEFLAGQKIHFTMKGGGSDESADGIYQVNGDHILLQVPNGIPMDLTRKGEVLEGSMAGMSVMFFKK